MTASAAFQALARDLDGRLAEVELGVPRRVAERDEDLLRVALWLEGHVRLDLGLRRPRSRARLGGARRSAWPCGAACRGVDGSASGQDLVDHGEVAARAWACRGPRASGSRGARGWLEDLLEGPPADPVVPADLALRGASRPAPCAGSLSTAPCRCAPFSRLLAWPLRRGSLGGGRAEPTGMVRCCRFRSRVSASGVLLVFDRVYTPTPAPPIRPQFPRQVQIRATHSAPTTTQAMC